MGTLYNVDISGNITSQTIKCVSTTGASTPAPVMTTTQINAIATPTKGMLAFDSTLNLLKFYDGTAWQSIESIGSLGTMAFQNANNVAITGGTANFGTAGSPNASAALQITSTTQGFGLPNMTSTQRTAIASPVTGLKVFDSTLSQECLYNGTAWVITG